MKFRKTDRAAETNRPARFRRLLIGSALLSVFVVFAAGAFFTGGVTNLVGGRESRATHATQAAQGIDGIRNAQVDPDGLGQMAGDARTSVDESQLPSSAGPEGAAEAALDELLMGLGEDSERQLVYGTPGTGYVRFTPQVAAFNHPDYSNFDPYNLNYSSGTKTGFQFGELWAYRSDLYPNYTQRVCIELALFRSVGGTVFGQPSGWLRDYDPQYDGPGCFDLAPGQGPYVQQSWFRPVVAGQIYTAAIIISWQVNGTLIARRAIDYLDTADYYCASGGPLCNVVNVAGVRGGVFLQF